MPVRLAIPPALTARRDWPHPEREPRAGVDAETVTARVTTGGMVRLALGSWRQAWVGSGRVSAVVSATSGVRSSP